MLELEDLRRAGAIAARLLEGALDERSLELLRLSLDGEIGAAILRRQCDRARADGVGKVFGARSMSPA